MRAEEIYVGTLFALGCVVLWGGAADGYLWFTGQPTITDFLRAQPKYFYAPLVVAASFVALLTTHLFLSGK